MLIHHLIVSGPRAERTGLYRRAPVLLVPTRAALPGARAAAASATRSSHDYGAGGLLRPSGPEVSPIRLIKGGV